MKTHYWRGTKKVEGQFGTYYIHHAWCGFGGGSPTVDKSSYMTAVPENVTCERCKKTTKWQEDMRGGILAKVPKHIMGKMEQAMWESGLWALELQEEYYPAYSKAAIRKMVADVYDISVSTVRDRERVAGAVPKDLRDMAPYLKYHHWRNIISAGLDIERAADLSRLAQDAAAIDGRSSTEAFADILGIPPSELDKTMGGQIDRLRSAWIGLLDSFVGDMVRKINDWLDRRE